MSLKNCEVNNVKNLLPRNSTEKKNIDWFYIKNKLIKNFSSLTVSIVENAQLAK